MKDKNGEFKKLYQKEYQMAALNKLADKESLTVNQDVNATGSEMVLDRKKSQMSA